MTMGMRIPCMLAIHTLLLCTSRVVLSSDLRQSNHNKNDGIVRKRIHENGVITDEAKDDIITGRQYLESLWDSLDKNSDRKLEEGRLRYLESMMSMIDNPTGKPTQNSSRTKPTNLPSPTPAPTKGPTLPTREPIPTISPTCAPSTTQPVAPTTPQPTDAPTIPQPTEAPTVPDIPLTGNFIPTGPCVEAQKDAFLLDVLTRLYASSNIFDKRIVDTSRPFLDKNTPQGMAYSFLREEGRFICSPTFIQRYGLATFYFALGGPSWTNNKGWVKNTHECNWYGVECNEDKIATGLNLAVNNLIGTLPNELRVVFGLQDINLFFNSVNGTLPNFDGLVNLRKLNLQDNLLTGPAFPSSITTLPRLISYRVSKNQLSGRIPGAIRLLRNLEELLAGDNAISGPIPPEIGNLRGLKEIVLNNNNMIGELPSDLGLLHLLEHLVINDNEFIGKIPDQLFNVASLDTLRLDGNFFVGTLPDFVGQLTDLTTFRVERNGLEGQIPESIGLMTSLVNLGLGKNFWRGTIPDVFENYKQLDFFDISNNNLVGGTIPRTIFSIPTLRLAYMANCSLTGSIPLEYADPPELRDLYLEGNSITGKVPPIATGKLEKLSELILYDNDISGIMPSSICDLRSNFILDNLWTDCSGPAPEIDCEFPKCCNRCFETQASNETRREN